MLLVKIPVPVPSVECEPVIDGLVAVPQQTPLAVMSLPLLSVMSPPDCAVVKVMDETAVVARVAKETEVVVNVNSLP